MRLFIALDVPERVRQQVLQVQQTLGQMTDVQLYPEPYSNLHMTLHFLGETPDDQIVPIRTAINMAEEEIGSISDILLSGPIEYRELDRLEMLVFRDDSGKGQLLVSAIAKHLHEINGFTPQFPTWLPHITLVRFSERPNLQPTLHEWESFHPQEAHIYRSEKVDTGGARYVVVADTDFWQDFENVKRYRVPFYLLPDGTFEWGFPNDDHYEIPERRWIKQQMPPGTTEGQFQGHVIYHPTEGEIPSWPYDPRTMKEPQWLTPEMKQKVLDKMRAVWESYDHGTDEEDFQSQMPIARTSAVMYHISPTYNRESILANGLDYSFSDERGRLPNDDDAYSEDGTWPRGQYLFREYDEAAGTASMEDDVYEINVDGLDVQNDPYLNGSEYVNSGDHAAYVSDPITPDRIRLVREGEPIEPYWERSANIFDPIQKELDQKVFTGITPKPTTLQFIQNGLEKLLTKTYDFPIMEYIDLYLTGSLTTYQYDETSDCDISVFVQWDMLPEGVVRRRDLVALMVDKLDGTILPGTQHPIQHFVVGKGIEPTDLYKPGLRSAFSFRTNEWIQPPERERVHDVANELPLLYHRAQLMAEKMELLLNLNPIYAKEFWHQIHRKRQKDQQAGLGDFSEGNIVYKYLLHNGFFDRIRTELGEVIAKVGWTDQSETFKIPQLVIDRAIQTMTCLHCQSNMLQENGTVWCGYCGWEPAHYEEPNDPQPGEEDGPYPWEDEDMDREAGSWKLAAEEEPTFVGYDPATDVSIQVIYDYEGDRIILVEHKESAEYPPGQFIGEYTNEDVILNDHHQAWLSPKYFSRLWSASFPDRPMRNLFIEADGEHHRIPVKPHVPELPA